MNMDEEKERKEQEAIKREEDRANKSKENKSKFTMSAVIATITKIVSILQIMLPIILASFAIAAIIHILNLEGDSSTAGVASKEVIEENVTIVESIDEDGNGQGYYFKIDKDILKKYLEELNRAYYLRILV